MNKIIQIAIAVVVALIFAAMFASPLIRSQAKKPVLTTSAGFGVKPALTSIQSENVNWVMNEVGAYKLNNDAQIETIVDGVVFTTTIKDNIPSTVLGTGDPDVRFRIAAVDFPELYSSSDVIATAKQMHNQSKLSIEILKSEITLAMKGYKSLYDEFA